MNNGQADLDSIRSLLRAGDYEMALGHAAELVDKLPELWEAYFLLGCACRGLGDLNNAQMALRGVLQAQPDHRGALRELTQVLEYQDELEAALATCQRLLALEPEDVGAGLKVAEIQAALGHSAAAEGSYRALLEIQPSNLPALLGAGHAARALGRREAAIDCYRRGLEAHPASGALWHSLANLKDYHFSEVEIDALERAVAASGEDAAALGLWFALGKACDDRAEYDRAWDCYRRGNALGERLRPWDRGAHEALVDALIENSSARTPAAGAVTPQPAPTPIFIVGLPRSGSTLVEQILASHSAIQATRELPILPRITRSLRSRRDQSRGYPALLPELEAGDFGLLAEDYLASAIPHLAGATPFFIDKMPNNFLHLGLIDRMFPRSPIVHVQREPLDVCVANLRHHFAREQNFAYSEENIAHYHSQYRRLMAHWDAILPGRIVHVSYESLAREPARVIPALLEALDLPLEPACLDFHLSERAIQTASSEQVRQPMYTSAIDYWRHYENHLGELRSLLESAA